MPDVIFLDLNYADYWNGMEFFDEFIKAYL